MVLILYGLRILLMLSCEDTSCTPTFLLGPRMVEHILTTCLPCVHRTRLHTSTHTLRRAYENENYFRKSPVGFINPPKRTHMLLENIPMVATLAVHATNSSKPIANGLRADILNTLWITSVTVRCILVCRGQTTYLHTGESSLV